MHDVFNRWVHDGKQNRRAKGCFSVIILTALFLVGMSSCGSGVAASGSAAQVDLPVTTDPGTGPGTNPGTSPGTNPGTSPTVPDPTTAPQVISGWLDSYDSYVQAKVSDVYPALLGLTAGQMQTVCPKWASLDRGTREKFWSALLWGIAGRESGRNRTEIYRETTMSTDSVTGQQVRSEGLLQLSYQDVPAYRYPDGDISWSADKTMALADYASDAKLGNPARTILNAYSNLSLGLFIMNRLAANYPTSLLETAYGKYWSTMRAGGTSFTAIVSGVKSKLPTCF